MLRMNPEYARLHDDKAERTIRWLVGNLGVKSFTTPKIETMDVIAADARRAGRAAAGAAGARVVAAGAGSRAGKARETATTTVGSPGTELEFAL